MLQTNFIKKQLMNSQNKTPEQGIRKAIEKFKAAWNIHDAAAFAGVFANDADFTNVFCQRFHGRAAIEAQHTTIFSSMFKASSVSILKTDIRFLNEMFAVVDVIWNMSGARDFMGNPWPDRKGLMSLVMQREGEEWFILVMHNMDLPAVPVPDLKKAIAANNFHAKVSL